ncbi:MAG: acyl carrier protein, partial [Pseudobdellovibrionaceae bacterium]
MEQIRPETIAIVNKILQEKFEVPQAILAPSAQIKEDLKLDSLDFVDMFVMLEEKTNSTVKNMDIMNMRTLGDIR